MVTSAGVEDIDLTEEEEKEVKRQLGNILSRMNDPALSVERYIVERTGDWCKLPNNVKLSWQVRRLDDNFDVAWRVTTNTLKSKNTQRTVGQTRTAITNLRYKLSR